MALNLTIDRVQSTGVFVSSFMTSGEIVEHTNFYKPLILGYSNSASILHRFWDTLLRNICRRSPILTYHICIWRPR